MANGYSVRNYLLNNAAQTIGASQTDVAITAPFPMSAEDSKFCLIRVDTSAVTVTNAITAKLQHSWDGGTTWEAVGSGSQVAIAGNASYQIHHDYADANTILTWPLARVIITTGASDAVTVDAVYVSRRY